MGKTIAKCIAVSNGEVPAGRWGKAFQCQVDHRRPPTAHCDHHQEGTVGVRTGGKISACDLGEGVLGFRGKSPTTGGHVTVLAAQQEERPHNRRKGRDLH
jgi:hypothetical protein